MRVLITGGAGFIGSNLSKHLLATGHVSRVRVIDDLSTGSRTNLSNVDVELIEGSILDQDLLSRALHDVDSVVHLAAIPSVPRSINAPRASHDANITGTLNVLEAARASKSVPHVIVASSSSVYGSNPDLPKRELTWTRPISPYAVNKLAAEAYALAYQASYGLETLAFRFFNVYGPGQAAGHAYAAVIPKFLAAAVDGEPLRIHGDGTQTRDFTYVGTVCTVLSEAIRSRVTSEHPVNLAFGTRTSLNELVELLEEELDKRLVREFEPQRIGDVMASQADSSRLRDLFGEVAPVSLASGLRETARWFREQASIA